MPFYKFQCKVCQKVIEKHLSLQSKLSIKIFCCGNMMTRLYSSIPPPSVWDKGSVYHNLKMRKDIEQDLKKRSRQDSLDKVGELVEKHGLKNLQSTSLIKNGRKRTTWDDK